MWGVLILPRPPLQERSDLECLVRLLQLGLKALKLIDTKEYYEDKLVRMLFVSLMTLLFHQSECGDIDSVLT